MASELPVVDLQVSHVATDLAALPSRFRIPRLRSPYGTESSRSRGFFGGGSLTELRSRFLPRKPAAGQPEAGCNSETKTAAEFPDYRKQSQVTVSWLPSFV